MNMPAIFFALLMPTLASAFPDGLGAGIALSEYQKQEWHVEDGLPQSNVRTIIQAKNRLLLVGTSEGIASFDGLRFAPFRFGSSLDNNHEPVNAILISKRGTSGSEPTIEASSCSAAKRVSPSAKKQASTRSAYGQCSKIALELSG